MGDLRWHFVPGTHLHPDTRDRDGFLLERFRVLIGFTQRVGVSWITENNVREFARRVIRQEQVMGCAWGDHKGDIPFTEADCLKLVGLRTNATRLKRKEFDEWMDQEERRRKT